MPNLNVFYTKKAKFQSFDTLLWPRFRERIMLLVLKDSKDRKLDLSLS